MTRQLIGIAASLSLATSLVAVQAAQQQQTPPPTQQQQQREMPDVRLTGCVTQGSGPTVFLLSNAKRNAEDTTEEGKTYVLVADAAEGEDIEFRSHLNHEVTITGRIDQMAVAQPQRTPPTPPTPPTGQQKVDEKTLPKLSAKAVTTVADTCSNLVR